VSSPDMTGSSWSYTTCEPPGRPDHLLLQNIAV
jgi:hypothetical protein